jgi:tetratricopeptide (TPR) repeat protein
VYFWRVQNTKVPAEHSRVLREAEFAFKQSFAYCPFSPEAVYKYVTLLVNVGRAKDAQLIADTSLTWDPDNAGLRALAENVAQIVQSQQQLSQQSGAPAAAPAAAPLQGPDFATLEARYQQDPSNITNAFSLASAYLAARRSNDGFRVLQALIDQTNASAQAVLSVAKAYTDLGHMGGLEHAFTRATEVLPNSPETWYDLARVQVGLNKKEEALSNLKRAVQLSNQRVAQDPKAFDVAKDAQTNKNFDPVRQDATFRALVGM